MMLIACRDEHLRHVGEADVFEAAKAIGVQAVEATVHLGGACPDLFKDDARYSIATMADTLDLQDALHRSGVKISAFCLHNQFDERKDEEIELVTSVVHSAVLLDVPAIRVDFMPRRLADDEPAFLELAIEVGRELAAAVGNLPVMLGVENHVSVNRLEFLRALLDGVDSPAFGLTLDTANFYWYGYRLSQLYEIYREFAPRVCHTHCKNIAYPPDKREGNRGVGWEYGEHACPLDEGDIDFGQVVSILSQAGYKGDLCIENESLGRFPEGERRGILAREAAHLAKAIAGA